MKNCVFSILPITPFNWLLSGDVEASRPHNPSVVGSSPACPTFFSWTRWNDQIGIGALTLRAEIAKNYLSKEEVETLELLVGQFLDFAELQAKRKKVMYMTDWKGKLDGFLRFNEQEILVNAGNISAEVAKELAHCEYERFSTNRRAFEADLADEELRESIKNIIIKGN